MGNLNNTPIISQCTRCTITEGFGREVLINYNDKIKVIPKGFHKYFRSNEIGNQEYDEFIKDNVLKSINPKHNGYEWDSFSIITNVIIDVSLDTIDIPISPILDELLVQTIEIRYELRDRKKLIEYLSKISGISLRSIHIVIKNIDTDKKFLDEIFRNPLVKNIVLIDSNKNSFAPEEIRKDMSQEIRFYDEEKEDWVFINIFPHHELISESKEHHTYFNRKLYISNSCQIKNAPECEEEFGNIRMIDRKELRKIVQKDSFQKYWKVIKDFCDVCNDCEFRNICVDRRVPKQRGKRWYYDKECGYNPYINKWKNEEGYLSLKETGIISSEQEFHMDTHKLDRINLELWGDL